MTWFTRMLSRKLSEALIKSAHQHSWTVDDGYRRYCTCGARQLLMENRWPKVGEPKYEWVTVSDGRKI